jgi:hypothetical protein
MSSIYPYVSYWEFFPFCFSFFFYLIYFRTKFEAKNNNKSYVLLHYALMRLYSLEHRTVKKLLFSSGRVLGLKNECLRLCLYISIWSPDSYCDLLGKSIGVFWAKQILTQCCIIIGSCVYAL